MGMFSSGNAESYCPALCVTVSVGLSACCLCTWQGNEEAQGLFVTTGGMDMLLTRTLQHMRHQPTSPSAAAAAAAGQEMAAGSSSSSSSDALLVDGGGLTRKELAVQLLLFLQFLVHWVVAAAVEAGEHVVGWWCAAGMSCSEQATVL